MKFALMVLTVAMAGLASAAAKTSPGASEKPVVYHLCSQKDAKWDALACKMYAGKVQIVNLDKSAKYKPARFKSGPRLQPVDTVNNEAIAGELVVAYIVTAEGKVALLFVESSTNQHLNAAVISALKDYQFEPAQVNGKAVPMLYEHRFSFRRWARFSRFHSGRLGQ
jgi:TonB family protein